MAPRGFRVNRRRRRWPRCAAAADGRSAAGAAVCWQQLQDRRITADPTGRSMLCVADIRCWPGTKCCHDRSAAACKLAPPCRHSAQAPMQAAAHAPGSFERAGMPCTTQPRVHHEHECTEIMCVRILRTGRKVGPHEQGARKWPSVNAAGLPLAFCASVRIGAHNPSPRLRPIGASREALARGSRFWSGFPRCAARLGAVIGPGASNLGEK